MTEITAEADCLDAWIEQSSPPDDLE